MENLETAFISLNQNKAYFCSLNMHWLTVFDSCIIKEIQELTIISEADQLIECKQLKSDLPGKSYYYLVEIIESKYNNDLVYFDLIFQNGTKINFHLGEVSLTFESNEILEQTCREIFKKAEFNVENTIQKLVAQNYYCTIQIPDIVLPYQKPV